MTSYAHTFTILTVSSREHIVGHIRLSPSYNLAVILRIFSSQSKKNATVNETKPGHSDHLSLICPHENKMQITSSKIFFVVSEFAFSFHTVVYTGFCKFIPSYGIL
jgi:hypothetical protein